MLKPNVNVIGIGIGLVGAGSLALFPYNKELAYFCIVIGVVFFVWGFLPFAKERPKLRFLESGKRPDGPPNKEMIMRIFNDGARLSENSVVWMGFVSFNESKDYTKDRIYWIKAKNQYHISSGNSQAFSFDISTKDDLEAIEKSTFRVMCVQSKQFPNGIFTRIRYTDTLDEKNQKWWPYDINQGVIDQLHVAGVNSLIKKLRKEGKPRVTDENSSHKPDHIPDQVPNGQKLKARRSFNGGGRG